MKAWENFLKKQEELLGKPIIDKWLRTLKVLHFDSGNLYLESKDSFQGIWFEEHIRPLLKRGLLNNNFRPIKVHLTVAQEGSVTSEKKQKSSSKAQPVPQLHFPVDPLNPAATLDQLIIGKSNKVLFQFLCELTGYTLKQPLIALGAFNPIYLWGAPGCGKTHILMALAHAFQKRGLKALYARAETFTEHVVSAIRASDMHAFRKAYRDTDILLVDDIHLLARKTATQEEFFHTFNALHTTGRQIILTANCAPAQLQEIEPRLVSRFEWGINLHFEKGAEDELSFILKKRAESLHFPLSEEVLQFLLASFPNTKSLHRALEALVLRCHLEEDARYKRNSQLLSSAIAERMLKDLLEQEQKVSATPEKIIAEVSSHYELAVEEITGKSQHQQCCLARQVAMYLCRKELRLPFTKIGSLFGRDHSTVMTSIKQVQKRLEAHDPEMKASIAHICATIST